MIVYAKELLLCGRNRILRIRLSPAQQTKLAATQARSFSDDQDCQLGALSQPRQSTRPGTHDDALRHTSSRIFAAM